MVIASGTRVRLTYIDEATNGTTPSITAGDTTKIRATSRNVNLQKNLLESEEVRSDRQIADSRHGFNQVGGSFGFELSLQSFDGLLANALSNAWAAVSISGSPDLGAVASSDTFTRDAGSFITDGLRVGDYVTTGGFSTGANNGTFRITAVASTAITVDGELADDSETSGPTMTYPGRRLDLGTTLTTMTLERGLLDVAKYQAFRGVAIQSMAMNIQPESIVGGTMNVVGMAADAWTGTPIDSSPAEPATNSPFSAFDGGLFEAGTQIAVITGIDFTLENGRTLEAVVGSKFSPDVFEGRARISGTITAMFESEALLNKFVNETESSIVLRLDDPNGTDFITIVFPRVKYNGGDMDPPQEGPVLVSLPFQALRDSTTQTSMYMQRSNS